MKATFGSPKAGRTYIYSSEPDSTPYIHRGIECDVKSIVKQHATPKEKLRAREKLVSFLDEHVRRKTEDAFSIVDASLYSYVVDTTDFHCNLIWVGNSVTDSKTYTRDAYQPESDGLQSCFLDGIKVKPRQTYPSKFNDYLPLPRSFECSFGGFSFNIWPPSPFHLPLSNLLKRYLAMDSRLPSLLAFLTSWLRSHDIPNSVLNDYCFALLFISFLQRIYKLPSFQWPIDTLALRMPSDVVPWPKFAVSPLLEIDPAPRLFDLRTCATSLYPSYLRNAKIGPMVYNFFRFWLDSNVSAHVVSTHKPWRHRQRKRTTKGGPFESSSPDLKNPSYWEDACLVVQDPFFTTHNHAQTVTKIAWKDFLAACRTSVALMKATAPVHAIFGSPVTAFPFGPIYEAWSYHLKISEPIYTLFQSKAPNETVLAGRKDLLARLETLLTAQFGYTFLVDAFGSVKYGVDSIDSDLDVVIIDLNRPIGNPPYLPEPTDDLYSVSKLALVLKQEEFTRIQAIKQATVPIVKFYCTKYRLNVDINCNNRLGICNTELIRQYCEAWKPMRHMIFFIKKWAKSWSLNDPSGTEGPCSFSSYCLVLMVVAFLQIRGVLPNLQSSAVGDVDRNMSGFWMKLEKRDSYLWADTRFHGSQGWAGVPMSLHSAILGWFRFFAVEMPYETHLLDIKLGTLARRVFVCDVKPCFTSRDLLEKSGPSKEGRLKLDDVADVEALYTEDSLSEDEDDDDVDPSRKVAVVAAMSTPHLEPDLLTKYPPIENEQPLKWTKTRFVVVDPFIRNKNCANACSDKVQVRFQQECQRALGLLQGGASVTELLGDGQPLFGGLDGEPFRKPRRNRQKGLKGKGS